MSFGSLFLQAGEIEWHQHVMVSKPPSLLLMVVRPIREEGLSLSLKSIGGISLFLWLGMQS